MVHRAFADGDDPPRPACVVTHGEVLLTTVNRSEDEMDLVTVLPRIVERSGDEHRPRCGCVGHSRTYEPCEQIGLQPQLLGVCDVLPRAAAACRARARRKVCAAWRDSMGGGTEDFNQRRGAVSFVRALQPHAHTLARNRQWNRYSTMPDPREALAGRPDGIDLDDEIVCGLRGRRLVVIFGFFGAAISACVLANVRPAARRRRSAWRSAG